MSECAGKDKYFKSCARLNIQHKKSLRFALLSSYLSWFNLILNAFFMVIYCEKVFQPWLALIREIFFCCYFRQNSELVVFYVRLMALFAFFAILCWINGREQTVNLHRKQIKRNAKKLSCSFILEEISFLSPLIGLFNLDLHANKITANLTQIAFD